MQATTYEILADLGPLWSAVFAGYAVTVAGVVYITPAGEEYLEDQKLNDRTCHHNPCFAAAGEG
jgi:hypothetical protein